MTIIIEGMDEVRRATRRWKRSLEPTGPIAGKYLNKIGRLVRDYSRDKITTQDNGKWEKLSKWSQAKTGRRKALITLRGGIVYRKIANGVEVYDKDPRQLLAKHSRGYTNPPGSGRVFIPLKNPGKLSPGPNLTSRGIFIRRWVPGTVPRRNVWGTREERDRIIMPIIRQWVREAFEA